MTARVLDGRAVAARLRHELAERVERLRARNHGRAPGLTILRDGSNEPATMYAAGLERAARAIGLPTESLEDTTDSLFERLAGLNRDPDVAGIVVAWPLVDRDRTHRLVELIEPDKDVDGATPTNAGRLLRGEPAFVPATALAVIELIETHSVPVAGHRAVVVGRSAVVGRPVASLLLARDATVVVCHRATPDLAAETRRAELLVVAAGVGGLIGADMVSPGTIVIDCGINPAPQGGIVGDVDPGVANVAEAMSPVPGGIGPVTPMMVLRQTIESGERIAGTA